jgi:transposase
VEAYQKGTSRMNELFLSAGIDAGADFSFMSIALPNQSFAGKPVKITHADLKSLERACTLIREAEEKYGLSARIFIESTSIYHYPLANYFSSKGFNVSVINPIITKSSASINIRKVENDKTASQKLALIGLNPKLKTSSLPGELVLNLRNLVREYYCLVDSRSAYITKLTALLKTAFPGYIGVFSKLTVETSLVLLEKYTSPKAFLKARKSSVVKLIRTTSRSGQGYAEKQYAKIIQAAKDALVFGYAVPSHFELIKSYISFIRIYSGQIDAVLASMHKFADDNADELFVKQIRLIETIKGAGFLSAATLMAEIGDFSAFSSPKQLFAYFGFDPSVKRSGNFVGTKNKMSKRGSAIARRAVHTISTVSIGKTRAGNFNNPILRQYYDDKCKAKPKLVALGAVAHKVCNIIFAVLRDNKPFAVISEDEHIKEYQRKKSELA